MTMNLEDFQKTAGQMKKNGERIRYSQEMKVFAVDYTKDEVAGGSSFNRCVKTLGLAEATLTRWMEAAGGHFRPVRMHKENSSIQNGSVTLVTPEGYRLEGLSIRDAVNLLQSLS